MALNASVSLPARAVSFGHVHRYELREALHQLLDLRVEIRTEDPALDVAALVGARARVRFDDEPVHKEVVGIVRTIQQLSAEPTGLSRYELWIVPPCWLTTRRTDQRIFQHRTVPEIVADVLAGYGERLAAPDAQLAEEHPAREYCVQYGETDWDFVLRILSEEGIAAMFLPDDAAGRTRLWLVDDTRHGGSLLEAPFVPPAGGGATPTRPHVSAVRVTAGIETSEVTLRDYDFERPMLVPQRSQQPSEPLFALEPDLESYGFEVGKFKTDPTGDLRARRRLEALRAKRRVLMCDTSFRLAPGTHFTLFDHPGSDVSGELLVVAAHTVAEQQPDGLVVRHELECVPATVRYRPLVRPKPRIHGTHTAFVVGQEGMEIDVDEQGRVEVEFRWDRRDTHRGGASRRVRVGQAWANAGYGFVLIPRVDEELIVAYADGDPDEPIIVGRVYDGANRAPVTLPAEQTRSVWRSRSSPGGEGYNQILMEDLAGSELLALHAHRDYLSETGRNSVTKVGADQSVEVGGNQSTVVTGGQTSVVEGSRGVSVRGEQNINVDGKYTLFAQDIVLSAAGEVHIQSDGDRYDDSNNHFIKSGSTYLDSKSVVQVVAPYFHVFAKAEIHLQVGGSSIHITPGGITITSAGNVDVNGAIVKLNCE